MAIEARGPSSTVIAAESRNVGEMFQMRCARSAHKVAYLEKRAGKWQPTTWKEFYDNSLKAARGLVELGLEPGESIAILGPTQPHWAVFDMGAHLAGIVSMGIYPRQSTEGLRYLLKHSGIRVVFVAGEDELRKVLAAGTGLESLSYIVPWSEAMAIRLGGEEKRILLPSRFRAAPLPEEELAKRLGSRSREDTAVLIYTSGTTGPPKGAMISHNNILTLLGTQTDVIPLTEEDISLSFLPMAHTAERILAFYGRISQGMATAYASSIASVLDELREVRPTIFGSVPRLFEKAYSKIQSEMERKPPLVQKLFAWASDVGRRRIRRVLERLPVPLTLEIQYRVADRLVFRKIRAAFGGRVHTCISGAAPIGVEILEFFWAAGIPIYEVYGQTEATVVTHGNREGQVKLGTVGRPLSTVECRIADDGEVLIRGPGVFQGYLKNPEATAETVADGWLHTGDIGVIDIDGYLRITDRKKHLIITAGGKNLTPANIEKAIKNRDPIISHVLPHGDRRPYVSALVAPSPMETLEWGLDQGLISKADLGERMRELREDPTSRTRALEQTMARIVEHPDLQARIRKAVRKGNQKLARVEQVRRFVILSRDFSQEHGELTPTMKLKRGAAEKSYKKLLDRIYEEKGFALEP